MRFTAHGTRGTIGKLVRYCRKPLKYRQKISVSSRAAVTDGWEATENEGGYLPWISMDNHLIDPGALESSTSCSG
jgi:hypothetical protein